MNGEDTSEDTFGIARCLKYVESSAIQFIELDCAGREAELRRLRSRFAARMCNHVVRVEFRRCKREEGKRYLYAATSSAIRALHDYLRDPAAAKVRGESLGRMVDRMIKEGGIISDSEFVRLGTPEDSGSAIKKGPPRTPSRHKRTREDSHSPRRTDVVDADAKFPATHRRVDLGDFGRKNFRMSLGEFEKPDAATLSKDGCNGETHDDKERCRDCGLVCEHPNSPRHGECQCANSRPCSPSAQASLQFTQKKEDEVIVIDD